jgi:hypothetical protein
VTGSAPETDASTLLRLGALAETSIASDGTAWGGASATACLRLWRLCAGLLGRYSTTLVRGGDPARSSRGGGDLLVTADLPLHIRRVILQPGLGIGVGWMRTTAGVANFKGEYELIDTGGLRLNAHLTAVVPLTRYLSFQASVAFDISPLVDPGHRVEDSTQFPTEPRYYGRLGLGLLFGRP